MQSTVLSALSVILRSEHCSYGKVQFKVELFADYLVEDSEQTLTRVYEEYQTSAAYKHTTLRPTCSCLMHSLSVFFHSCARLGMIMLREGTATQDNECVNATTEKPASSSTKNIITTTTFNSTSIPMTGTDKT